MSSVDVKCRKIVAIEDEQMEAMNDQSEEESVLKEGQQEKAEPIQTDKETDGAGETKVEKLEAEPIPVDESKARGSKWIRLPFMKRLGKTEKYYKVATAETGNERSKGIEAETNVGESNEEVPAVENCKEGQQEKVEPIQVVNSSDVAPSKPEKLKGGGMFAKMRGWKKTPAYETVAQTNESEEVKEEPIPVGAWKAKVCKWSRFSFKISRGRAKTLSKIDTTGSKQAEAKVASRDSSVGGDLARGEEILPVQSEELEEQRGNPAPSSESVVDEKEQKASEKKKRKKKTIRFVGGTCSTCSRATLVHKLRCGQHKSCTLCALVFPGSCDGLCPICSTTNQDQERKAIDLNVIFPFSNKLKAIKSDIKNLF